MVWTTPKTFTAGERLFAQDLNTYVSDNLADLDPRTVKSFADASARSTAIPSPSAGAVTFLEDTDTLEVYDGSAWTAVGATPAILQVVSTTKTDVFSTTSTSYTDVTDVTVSITPSSASSKILVMFYGMIGSSNQAQSTFIRLVRNSTDVFIGDAGSSRERATTGFAYSNNSSATVRLALNASFSYVDSPATTSATTYKIQMRVSGGTGTLGAGGQDLDTALEGRFPSSLIVAEVAG